MISDSLPMDNVVNCLPPSTEVASDTSKKKFCDVNKYCHVEILLYLDLKSLLLCATVNREWKTRVDECFAKWQKTYGFTVCAFIGQNLPVFAGANITKLPVKKTAIYDSDSVGSHGTLASLVHRLVLKDYPGQMCVEGEEYGLAELGASLEPKSGLMIGVKHLDVELLQQENSVDIKKLCTILTKFPNVLASVEHFTLYFNGENYKWEMEKVAEIVLQMPQLQVLTCGLGFLAHLNILEMSHEGHLLPTLTTLDLDTAYSWEGFPYYDAFHDLSHLTSLSLYVCDCDVPSFYDGLRCLSGLKELKLQLSCGFTVSAIELTGLSCLELSFLDGFYPRSSISKFLCVAPLAKKLVLDFCCDDGDLLRNSCATAEQPYKPTHSQKYAQEISTCSDRFGKCLEYVEDFTFKLRLEKGMELFLVLLDVLQSSAPNLSKLTLRVSELNVEHLQRLSSFSRTDSRLRQVRLQLWSLPGELSILKEMVKSVKSALDFGNIERIVIQLDRKPNWEQIDFLRKQFSGQGFVCRVLDPTEVVHPAVYLKVSGTRPENAVAESESFGPPAAKKNKLNEKSPLYFYVT